MGVNANAAPNLLDASIEDIQAMLSSDEISSVDLVLPRYHGRLS